MQPNSNHNNTLFNIIIEESTMPIALYVGEEMIIEIANKEMLKVWRKDNSVIGLPLSKVFDKIEGQPFLEILKNVFHTGISYQAKEYLVVLREDGEVKNFYFDFTYKPLIDDEGKVWAVLNNASDVTELVKSKSKCEESERLFRQMIYDAPVAIGILKGPELIIEEANDELLKLWGKSNSILGLKLVEGLPEIINQPFPQLLNEVYHTGIAHYGYETLALLEHEGVLDNFYFNFVYDPIRDIDGGIIGIMIVANEVTDQVKNRYSFIESEDRFRNLVLDNPIATAFYETEDIVIKIANNEMLKMWGKDDSVIGKPLIDGIPELAGQPFIPLMQEVYRTGIAYHADQQEAELIFDGKPIKGWYNFTFKPLRNSDGEVYAILHAAIDVTKQVLLQQQKDEFLGIASHELKTPVTSIKAYAQVLERMIRKDGDEKKADMVRKMDLQLNRLTNLIGDLLDVTKIHSGKMTFNSSNFEFDSIVDETVGNIQYSSVKHHIETDLRSNVSIYADYERIGQVITNFLTNAIKYSIDANKIIVKTYTENNEVIFSVQDFGIGIPKELQSKVFDQFYRVSGNTQHNYPGLGLGLFISAEIIRGEGGRVWLKSEEGIGSTFYFALKI